MGKKRRGHPDVEDILSRPWCYYCERDFEDLKLLISHQKAKHFKCDRCGRRLNTAGGLAVHLNQVHKETLEHVENALPNRQGTDIEIFGMEGIPAEILEQHRNRIIQNFYQAQEDRRLATGNPPPGHSQPRKKIKIENAEELLARFKEFQKARNEGALDPNNPNGTATAMEGVVATGPSPGGLAVGDLNNPYPPPAQPGFDQGYGQPGLPPVPPQGFGGYPGDAGLPTRPGQPDDIDQLIRMAEAGVKPQAAADAAAADDKKAKKEKKGRMVYDDAETSPEERMSKFARYAYAPATAAA